MLVAPPSGRSTALDSHQSQAFDQPLCHGSGLISLKEEKSVRLTWYSGLYWSIRGGNPQSYETNMSRSDKLAWTVLISTTCVPVKKGSSIYFQFYEISSQSDWGLWLTLPPCWQTLWYHLLSLVPCNYRQDHPLTWEGETNKTRVKCRNFNFKTLQYHSLFCAVKTPDETFMWK